MPAGGAGSTKGDKKRPTSERWISFRRILGIQYFQMPKNQITDHQAGFMTKDEVGLG
jgi:hypothetical protein